MWGEALFREAYAYNPQSTVADVLNLALIRLGEPYEAEMMLQNHDEFIIQCEHWCVDAVIVKIRRAFNIPIIIQGKRIVLPIDIKIGSNWDEMKEVGGND